MCTKTPLIINPLSCTVPVGMTDDVAHHFGAYVKPIEFVAMLLLEMLREIVGAALVG